MAVQAGKMEPVRTCVGCRKLGTRSSLIRLTSANGQVVVDFGKKLSGRGAWLHASQDCLKLAVDRKAFGRALGDQYETDVQALTRSIEQAETMLAKNE